MTLAQTCREAIALLTPPARAFERAKDQGLVFLDDQLGFIEADLIVTRPPKNPDQLRLTD